MLEDYYKESDEQFLALIDAYGTGRSDANIEEIIKKIYVLARSNPWPDEWYEQVIDTYTGMVTAIIRYLSICMKVYSVLRVTIRENMSIC